MNSLREDAKAFKRKFLEKYPNVNGMNFFWNFFCQIGHLLIFVAKLLEIEL